MTLADEDAFSKVVQPAESARAVTGRRSPTDFFYETCWNSGTKSQKFYPKVGNEQSRRGLKMGHWPKLGSYGKNRIFWPKTEILGPKKTYTSWRKPWSGHDQKKLFKEKNCLCPNNYLPKYHFGWFFGLKPIFRPKTTFRPNVKTPVSP